MCTYGRSYLKHLVYWEGQQRFTDRIDSDLLDGESVFCKKNIHILSHTMLSFINSSVFIIFASSFTLLVLILHHC